jgi:hypothetical protein
VEVVKARRGVKQRLVDGDLQACTCQAAQHMRQFIPASHKHLTRACLTAQ